MRPLDRLLGAIGAPRRIAGGRAAGLKLAAPARADPAFVRGTYEAPIQDAIAEQLGPGDVFYDIGANIGFFSLVASRAAAPGGRVYAFEPVPRNAAAIRKSVRLNRIDGVEVYAVAVARQSGPSVLRLARHIGGSALVSGEPPPDVTAEIVVEAVSLDDALAGWSLRPPNLIKIDVEGAELNVLAGMGWILGNLRPTLIYELDDATREGLERKGRAIAELLTGLRYELTPLPAAYPSTGWQVCHVLARAV